MVADVPERRTADRRLGSDGPPEAERRAADRRQTDRRVVTAVQVDEAHAPAHEHLHDPVNCPECAKLRGPERTEVVPRPDEHKEEPANEEVPAERKSRHSGLFA